MLRRVVFVLFGLLPLCSAAFAEDAFFRIRLNDLKFTEGELPDYRNVAQAWQRILRMTPEVQIDEPGEAYLRLGNSSSTMLDWAQPNGLASVLVVIRVSAKQEVHGRLIVPQSDGTGMLALKFRLPADSATKEAARAFQFAKIEHYERRLISAGPGAAWYRAQSEAARKDLGVLSVEERVDLERVSRGRWSGIRREDGFDRSYELFSGGRAVSENLQLDRELLFPRGNSDDAKPVPLYSIKGITVKEIDWEPLIKNAKPQLDALASSIPADQHVVFFPSFAAALKVADEAKLQGTAVLRQSDLATQDTHLLERYEQQLGLSLSTLGRLIGPQVVSSVAVTGGDPYFETGTDVAVLFETKQPSVLSSLLLTKIRFDAVTVSGAKPIDGTIDGIKYVGLRSPDRRVCSYVAELDRAVIVTNSPAQLQRLAAVRANKSAAIASLPEYVFFRQRYQLGDASESALLFLSDATIRRWCGPRWRIASSRRTRDAAILSQLQAMYFDALVTGKAMKLGAVTSELPTSQPANFQMTSLGVTSPQLGRLDFLTPISELTIDTVTHFESTAYERWRDGYQNNWSWAFDPIALRVGTDEKRLMADLSVMPLIARSEYRDMLRISTGVALKSDAGDPHDTVAHFILALNRESEPIQQANRHLAQALVGNQAAGLGADKPLDPLGWLGQSITVYADRDPYWLDLAKLDRQERQRKLREDGYRLPFALRIEVQQPLKLALFLTAVKSTIQQAAPNLTRWDTQTHREQQYVKIAPARRNVIGTPDFDNFALYYGIIGDGLVFTPNEDVLKRAIDRQLARDGQPADTKLPDGSNGNTSEPLPGWLGESFAVRFDGQVPSFISNLDETDYRQLAQTRSWSNLPILNEWKRRYPDLDPVEVHRRFWGVELVCPSGAHYVWNENWRTMESPVFGHPGEPKLPDSPALLFPFAKASFGVTFELDGLRSRLELWRQSE